MVEQTKKGDFVEIEFIGKSQGEVFDTNILDEAKKLNPKAEIKPLILKIGESMVVPGFDKALEGKELGKKHLININSEQGFGKRDSKLIRLMPKKIFIEQEMMPTPGLTVAFDNNLGKIISVSGGRVLVDFNNPLAGKDIEYEFTIKRMVNDLKEKAEALQHFLFGQAFPFEIDENKKTIVFQDLKLASILQVFNQKFKDTLGYGVEILEKKKKEDNKEKKDDKKKEGDKKEVVKR